MTMGRLSNLALMNIHRDITVDYDDAVKIFMQLHPRKILLTNLIYEECHKKKILKILESYFSLFNTGNCFSAFYHYDIGNLL